jgi:hypothetical protein
MGERYVAGIQPTPGVEWVVRSCWENQVDIGRHRHRLSGMPFAGEGVRQRVNTSIVDN